MDLGYNKNWIELRIISEEGIQHQKLIQKEIDDFHDEHMRYRSLVNFYNESKININNINKLVHLLDNDGDQLMAVGFYIFLINKIDLCDEIFSIVSERLSKYGANYIQEVNRAGIKREFQINGSLSKDTIEKFIFDSKFHRILIESTNDQNILKRIENLTNSKKIKNFIKAKLSSLHNKFT